MLRCLSPPRQLHLEVQRNNDRRQNGHICHREGCLQKHWNLHVRGAQRCYWQDHREHPQPGRQR